MAGSMSAATAIALGSLAVAGVGTGVSIYNGQKQNGMQQQALQKQNTAQQTAQAQALSTERQSEVAQGAANQQTPDLTGILKRAAALGTGPSSTMLTGPGGAAVSGQNLGKTTLLGA